jgi:protein TonB
LNVLHAPKTIPKDVKMIREEELPPPSAGVVGGVAGGVPGGQTGGILGGMIGGIAPPPPPPPKKEAPKGPARIGGNVMAANLIRQVKPTYPPLARQARISGTVVFSAMISKEGTIENLALVSGHPLLVQAARDAVSQWVYKPTLLNGEPTEVATTISVNFTLSGQ